jgi:hypothetical protein
MQIAYYGKRSMGGNRIALAGRSRLARTIEFTTCGYASFARSMLPNTRLPIGVNRCPELAPSGGKASFRFGRLRSISPLNANDSDG